MKDLQFNDFMDEVFDTFDQADQVKCVYFKAMDSGVFYDEAQCEVVGDKMIINLFKTDRKGK